MEDRQTTHAEWINNTRNIIKTHPGGFVMARTAIQSDKAKDKAAKLSYVVRGPFQSFRDIGCGNYIVRKMNKPDNPELNFMSDNFYILPTFLKPCEQIDISDTRYLNQSHAPIVNPLNKDLNIELYNEK